jgi:hypothetical protein
MIWCYFDNRAGDRETCFATRSLARPIYRDVGATIPT